MVSALYSLLILAGLAATASEDRHIDAVEVFSCDFGADKDINYDGWPDSWQRRQGLDWPQYIDIGLEEDGTTTSGRCLSIHLNGGNAAVSSGPIYVSDKFSYVIEARLRSTQLKNSRVQVRVEFSDDNNQILEVSSSPWFKETAGWEKIHIGPVSIQNHAVTQARVTLLVERGDQVDLTGKVSIGDIWVARLPRMNVRTNNSVNVYTSFDDVRITCELSGILEKDPDIHFELRDASSELLDNESIKLNGVLINERVRKASDIIKTTKSNVRGYAGITEWRPKISQYGFYRVIVSMQTKRGTLEERVISLAVVPPIQENDQGEFGLSLAGDNIPLSYDQLEELLPRIAVSWIKLPVWYGQSEPERGEQLVQLAERLAAHDIEIIGVIDRPPKDIDFGKSVTDNITIADLLSSDEPSAWLPSLDAVLTRLSLRVRWWQLGVDGDTSFSNFNDLETEISELRSQLFRFGQDVKLGLGWPWNADSTSENRATWDFLQFTATPSLTGKEIATYLSLPKRPGVARWASIVPLDRRHYDLETRIRDFVQQILAAKTHDADGIFVAKPFDNYRGLMTEKGTAGELLLPWRTTASLLSGAKYLGQIRLPNRSENRIFETASGKVVMVVWNLVAQEETLYLGEEIHVLDVWGRETTPRQIGHQQQIEIGSLPTFIQGLDPGVAKWRMQANLVNPQIPSVMEEEHLNHISLRNTFKQGVGGTIKIITPDGWTALPEKIGFKLAVGEQTVRPFEIVLPFDANNGPATLQIDFDISADKNYHFSIFRDVNVGDRDIKLELHTHIDKKGMLVVDQRMINHSQELVDFKCLLYAKDRRTQKMQVFRLGNSHDIQTYRYPNGRELLGTNLWLRVEELGGTRVLNHRITIQQ